MAAVRLPPVSALAFSVHLFTACGAGLALLALLAAAAQHWTLMFFWLGLALIVDGVDGALARAVGTRQNAARWSGDVLDLVVDFTTYVFVPAYAIVSAGLMPREWALPAGFAIVVTAALYFADTTMKADDNRFVGFPAVWNLIAFYLLLLRPAPWIAIVTIAAFAILTFLPVRFVHPVRVRRLRAANVAMLGLWAILACMALWQDLAPPSWVVAALCLTGVYFLTIGLLPARSESK
jgi:phosphatidylcholine synthase